MADFCELIRDKMRGEFAAYDEQFPTDDESLAGILGFFTSSDEFFALVHREDKRIIGFFSLNKVDENTRNAGFCVHSAYRNKGYASEAFSALIDYARDTLGVAKLVSGTADVNIPSVRLLEKFGFVKTGSSTGSFARDDRGNPIILAGGTYEKRL